MAKGCQGLKFTLLETVVVFRYACTRTQRVCIHAHMHTRKRARMHTHMRMHARTHIVHLRQVMVVISSRIVGPGELFSSDV